MCFCCFWAGWWAVLCGSPVFLAVVTVCKSFRLTREVCFNNCGVMYGEWNCKMCNLQLIKLIMKKIRQRMRDVPESILWFWLQLTDSSRRRETLVSQKIQRVAGCLSIAVNNSHLVTLQILMLPKTKAIKKMIWN